MLKTPFACGRRAGDEGINFSTIRSLDESGYNKKVSIDTMERV
jgi:hypothetical protein